MSAEEGKERSTTAGEDNTGSDEMIDISSRGRQLLAHIAAVSGTCKNKGYTKYEPQPRKDIGSHIYSRTTKARTLINEHERMTSDLRYARYDMEKTDMEIDWFLKDFKKRNTRKKYQVLERPEEFVSAYDKYSMTDFT